MKGFSVGAPTVYFRAATVCFTVELLPDGHKYRPMTVPKKSNTTEKWEPQVERALQVHQAEGTLRVEDMILV